jgi:hypothetical protein
MTNTGIKCSHCDKPGCDYPQLKPCPACRQHFCRDHLDPAKHMCGGQPKVRPPQEEEEPMRAPWH